MIDIKSFSKPKSSGGGSVGGSSSVTYIPGIATEAEHATRADRAKRADSADQAGYANQSGTALTANYAATAGEVKEDAEILQNFLRKDEADTTEEVHRKVDFKKDVNFGGKINAEKEAVFKGNATFYEALVDLLHSVNFNSATQAGFGFTKNNLGRYGLSITNLEVWGKAVYNELQIRKLTSVGGNVWLSAASSKIVYVEGVADGSAVINSFKCYFLAEEGGVVSDNPWKTGDLARCETYEESGGKRLYWMEVTKVSSSSDYVYDAKDTTVKLFGGRKCHSVVLSTGSMSESSNTTPIAGDTIVLDGHRLGSGDTDTDRTNLICIESTGSGTPRIMGLAGITGFTHEDKDVFVISPTGVQFKSEYLKFISAAGKEISALSLWYEVTFDNEKVVYDPNTKAFTPADFGAFHVVRHEGDTQTQLAYEDIENYYVLYIYGDTKGYSTGEGTDSVSTAILVGVGDATGVKTVKACYYNYNFTENYSETILDALLENGGVPTDEMVTKYGLQLLASNSMAFLQGGENGADGKGALEFSVSPDTIVLDANSNGLVTSFTGKTARISCYRDGTNVTSKCTFSIPSDKVINCTAAVSSSGLVAIKSVSKQTLSDSSTVSMTSGSVMVEISDTTTSKTYYAQVKFAVNVAAYTGTWMATTKSLSSKYTELSTKVTNTGNEVDSLSHELNKVSSSIEQTAREISLSVTEKAAGRRNLLPGSAFRRQDDGPILNFYEPYGDQGIYMGEGIGGTNCVKCKSYYDGTTTQYSGVYWRALGETRNVKIERGKKYVMSCWVKCDSTTKNRIYFENHLKESATSIDRLGNCPMSPSAVFTVKEAGVWELFSCVIDATSAKYDYLEVIFLVIARTAGETVNAWFCRPMLEEGEEYNGWTLSEQDYDYMGGNLLDNARSLTLGDNLSVVQGSILSSGYEAGVNAIYAKASSSSYTDILQWGSSASDIFAANTDYVFSFMAKGSGELAAFFCREDGDTALLTETYDGTITDGDTKMDGKASCMLDGGWHRYWVHWRTKSSKVPQMVLLRAMEGATVYVTQPKLEVGATVTAWTEKRSDMVERQALLATGIDITNKKIIATADNFIVRNNSGKETLVLNSDGLLNTNLVRAKALSTFGDSGIHIEIEDGLMQCFGTSGVANTRFGIDDNGYSVLSFYDNNGIKRYDLGPEGMKASSIESEKLDTLTVCTIVTIIGSDTNFYSQVARSTGKSTQTLNRVRLQRDKNVFGSVSSTTSTIKSYKNFDPTEGKSSISLYRYTAARIQGTAVKSDKYGLTTAELADKADGMYFTSTTMGSGGSLTNLATGKYFICGTKTQPAPYPFVTADAGTIVNWPIMVYGGYVEILNGRLSSIRLYSYYENNINQNGDLS